MATLEHRDSADARLSTLRPPLAMHMWFFLIYSLTLLPRVFMSSHDQAPVSTNNGPAHHAAEARNRAKISSVAGFTQKWFNTRYRNRHTIVVGSVPVGTVLNVGV